jgi:hypothetical protein
MARTRTLAQVVGVETAAREKDNNTGVETQKRLKSEPLTSGHNHVYFPLQDPDQEGAKGTLTAPQPNSYKPVAVTVEAALKEMMRQAIPAIDTVATKDATNQGANADVIVNEYVLLPKVPVSHLLWLEKYLGEWRKKSISILPVLDPTKDWTLRDSGIYESAPADTQIFTREVVPLILHPGNDKHAPQVQPLEKQVHVGHYTKSSLSGAVYESRKQELLDRFDLVISAVKDAIARANQTTAVEVSEGVTLMSFLLA